MGKADLNIRLKLLDAKRFQAEMQASGKATKTFSTTAKKAARGLIGMGVGLAGLAKAKDAVNVTADLAKGTARLASLTGMATDEASRWVATAKVRDVNAQALSIGFVSLSKNILAANRGGKEQSKIFKSLGVSQKDLKNSDTSKILLNTADAFEKMGAGSRRTAFAQKLFAKQSKTLLPMLSKGSGALKEQLSLSDKYGTTMNDKQVKAVLEGAAAEREMELAMLGLKIAFATEIIPTLTEVTKYFGTLLQLFRAGPRSMKVTVAGLIGFSAAIVVLKPFVFALYKTFALLLRGLWSLTKVLKILNPMWVYAKAKVVVLNIQLAILWVRLKLLAIWTRVVAVASRLWAAAMWLVNGAMAGNPIAIVIIAIVALGTAIVIAYKKIGWFRRAVQAVWNFLKTHWAKIAVILGGPLGAAVVLVIKNFGRIKSAVISVVKFVASKFFWLVNLFTKPIRAGMAKAFHGIFDPLKNAFKTAINWIISKWNNLEFGMDAVKIKGKTVIPGVHIKTPNIPMLGSGGFVAGSQRGSWITGEAGPEINTMTSRGVTVQPLSSIGSPALAAAGGGTIVTKVYLDKRQIAEAVGDYAESRRARR